VIIAHGELVLLHAGGERRESVTPEIYTRLKQVSHLPLGIFGALIAPASGIGGGDGGWREELAALAAAASAVKDDIDRLPLTEAQRLRQHALIDTGLAFIASQQPLDRPDPAALDAYARRVAPWTLANATEAADAQLDAMHAVATRWRAELGEEAWSRLYVLIPGPKTPRADNLAVQYFTAALGPGSLDTRVIYTEGIFDEGAGLGLLGTLLIDRRIGAAFYGDPARMERDLLADAATAKVLQLFGKFGSD
jgi:hypothetical protein